MQFDALSFIFLGDTLFFYSLLLLCFLVEHCVLSRIVVCGLEVESFDLQIDHIFFKAGLCVANHRIANLQY